jgi:hypothetical protein
MTTNSVRTYLGLFIVVSHFLILVVVVTSPLYAHFQVRQAISLATVIAPLTAGFTTAIIRYFVRHRVWEKDSSEQVIGAFIFISFFLPTILFLATLFFFLGFALNFVDIDFETSRWVITGLEALFGIYVGFVLEGLFEYAPPDLKNGTTTPSNPPTT